MNRPLRRITLAVALLFVALLGNATWLQVGAARGLDHRADNPRPLFQRFTTNRGIIRLQDGTVIAESVRNKDGRTYDRRYYSDPKLFATVTGWAGVSSTSGIEQAEDDLLSGNDDRLAIRNFTDILAGKEKQGGYVVVTVDPAAQKAATSALQAKLGSSGHSGAVVAIDVRTGAVKALVSLPTYDPTPLAGHSSAAVQQAYTSLLNAPGNPLLDRATQTRWPPGSMFKLVTSAAALSTGRYKPDSVIDAPPSYTPPLTTLAIKNFAGELCGAGKLTLADALATSCNTAFAKLGTALGQGPLENQANAFGIGKPPPSFPLPLARSIFATGTLDAPAIAQSAIGQRDVALTPMQAALMTAAIANKGIALDPYLVAEEHAPDNSVLKSTTPTPLGQALSADVATQLTQMMVGVTTKGTAAGVFNDLGYAVAGKTGTAQHGDNVPPHTWFAGFAPADNPQYAVVAFVEDGGTAGTNAQGASVSAPIVHDVLKALVKP